MPNNFKLYCTTLTDTSETTLITATGTSVFLVGSIIISNVAAATDSTVDLVVTDTSAAADFNILKTESIKRTVSREVLSKTLVLENLDVLKVQAADANVYDVMISYLDRNRD